MEKNKTLNTFDNSHTLEFNENQTKINLILSYNGEFILFKVIEFSLPRNEYELLLSLEQLYKINRYFYNFEKNKDLVDSLINEHKDKQLKINFKDQKCNIIIFNPITRNHFELTLNNMEKNMNSKIEDLLNIIKEDRKRIEILENKVSNLEKIILEKEKNFFHESQILNKEEKKLLLNWLPFKPDKISLLLNSNRDGDSLESFHRLCGGKCPTYGIIETTKGHKFGGYTTKSWGGGLGQCIADNNAFIFSLDTKKKYNIKNPEKAIGIGDDWLLFFGYNENSIVTYKNGCNNNRNYIEKGAYGFDTKNENGGEYNFTMKSYEVYEIK